MRLTERQKEIATGLTILVVTAGAFASGEVLLRVVQMAKFGTATTVEQSQNYRLDEPTGLRLPVPGSTHGYIHYSSLGFRGPEILVPKPDRTLRIAYLGSSTTLDAYSTDSSSWPAIATDVVRRGIRSCDVDYLNAGVAGFATDRMLRYFDGRVRQAQPDVVVVLPRDLNLDLDNYAVSHGLHDGVHVRPSWLAQHSVLWSKLEMNATILRRQRLARRTSAHPTIPAREVAPEFERRLRSLVSRIRATGPAPVLLEITGQVRRGQTRDEQVAAASTDLFYMPYVTIDDLLDLRDEYNRVIRRVGAELGVPVIGAHLDVPGDPEHFKDSLHYTPAGSALAGRAIGTALLDLDEIRQLDEQCSAGQNLR
jgi:hypothetical protein